MRYQHVTFRKLAVGEEFFTNKFRYTKSSFFTGRMVLDGELVFVSPWRKVRSTRPFGKPAFACSVGINNVALGCCAPQAGEHLRPLNVLLPRTPQTVTPGGDRTPEAIGGNELTPSA